MNCPHCSHGTSKVVDSRTISQGREIRRRRECLDCQHRFTTYERLDSGVPLVIKKNGIKTSFDPEKVKKSIQVAAMKRPIPDSRVRDFLRRLEARLANSGTQEVSSREIGDAVLGFLRENDDVAYLRFASVYKDVKDAGSFERLLEGLHDSRDPHDHL